MAAPQQADADPVVAVLNYLRAHPDLPDLLGGPATDHVSGIYEAPWPHLAVEGGNGGDLRDLRWAAEHEIALTLFGHPNGAPGKAAMWKIAMRVLAALKQMPDVDVTDPTVPVVSEVTPSGVATYRPMSNGQPAYTFGVMVTIRPPRVLPDPGP